ncbi:hypothetical protein [Paraburkholderia sediminicola]|uniref:hypothetical protein n=1 Tax=Paraburkholderia sediminicola TaxID=458836 RepID=UPI0038B7ABBC
MADSPEHKFISEALDLALKIYSETRLLGLSEADRRSFDYGCLLLRDASRPLVSQVLWSHAEGIEKDIRSLIFDGGSSLKLYFVRDRIKNRAKIDEVLNAYRSEPSTKDLLKGLRIIPIPEGFDADKEAERQWMQKYLLESVSSDLLFAVVFGKLTHDDVRRFSLHGGPLGLKIAALQVIETAKHLQEHGPSFEAAVGSKGSPLREVLAMLGGIGLIMSPGFSTVRLPTLKGRFLLDLARLLTFERGSRTSWSPETKLILKHLRLEPDAGWQEELTISQKKASPIDDLLNSINYARRQFDIDIMENLDANNPVFHTMLALENYTDGPYGSYPGLTAALWNDPDDFVRFGTGPTDT